MKIYVTFLEDIRPFKKGDKATVLSVKQTDKHEIILELLTKKSIMTNSYAEIILHLFAPENEPLPIQISQE